MKIDDYIKKYNQQISIIGAIAIISAVYTVFAIEAANADYWEAPPEEGKGGDGNDIEPYSDSIPGQLNEGDEEDYNVSTGNFDYHAEFTLTWDDESAPPGHTNQGDTFRLEVTDPEGWEQDDEVTNSPGNEGMIQLTFNVTEHYGSDLYDVEGDWLVKVILVDCGQNTLIGTGLEDPLYPDDDNSYDLDIEIKFVLQ
jgi:hypothetical protein